MSIKIRYDGGHTDEGWPTEEDYLEFMQSLCGPGVHPEDAMHLSDLGVYTIWLYSEKFREFVRNRHGDNGGGIQQ